MSQTSTPIILVSHGFQTNYERGFSNGLSRTCSDVTLISSDRTDYSGLSAAVKTVNLRGSQEENRSRKAKAWNMLSYHLKLMVHALLHPRSVVHVIGLIDPPLLCGVIEGLWFRLVSRRYVLTVHDLLPHDRHTPMNLRLFGWSFRLAHRLVVHTPKMAQDLHSRYGIGADKITVMEHGIEFNEAAPTPHDPPANQPYKHLLFFGKLAPYKGLDLLLGALAEVKEPFRLTIAGACPDNSFRQKIKQQIAEHPHKDWINWRDGFIQEADMEALFQSADALVLPYRHIDQSGVLFQALKFGVPMLATRVGDFARYITPDVGEVCEPENQQALQQALEELLKRLESISRDAIRDKAAGFNWTRTVTVLRSAYS